MPFEATRTKEGSPADFEAIGEKQEVWLTLPKFKIDWGIENVAEELKALGMPVSGPQNDFETLGAKEDIYVTTVLHRAVVKVDEEGTEAAAVTMIATRAGAFSAPAFRCDHPFLFAIRDTGRNEILFIGRFTLP